MSRCLRLVMVIVWNAVSAGGQMAILLGLAGVVPVRVVENK